MADEASLPPGWFGLGGWIEAPTSQAGGAIKLPHAKDVSNAMSFYRVLAQ